MCGIAGYTGKNQALPYILDILSFLEYRGYDSAGVAYFKPHGEIGVVKTKGRISALSRKVKERQVSGNCIIGHTRWATHGEPSDANAHPHGTDNVQIVHNGIIENSDDIRSFLWDNGYDFVSRTDTESVAKLIDFYFKKSADPKDAIKKARYHLKGSYAIAALFKGFDNAIYTFRKDSPLVVAPGESGFFLVSDISALSGYAQCFYSVDEEDVVCITSHGIEFEDKNGTVYQKEGTMLINPKEGSQENQYPHYMLKEIYEDASSVLATVENINTDFMEKKYSQIHIIGCGTAFNAGLCAGYHFRNCNIPIGVHIASEFRYYPPHISSDALCVFVSQSGETADTLAALQLAKTVGADTLAIVNSPMSAMAKEAKYVIATKAGQEISVASTKAYVSQLAALYVLASRLSDSGTADEIIARRVCPFITPNADTATMCKEIASFLAKAAHVFFIGRGRDYAIACEFALKAREISYINCNAYPAGELKHGSIALVEKGTPVVAVITDSHTADKVFSNISEVKSRGARVVLVVGEGITYPRDLADFVVRLPKTENEFVPLVCAPVIQLVAYYMAVEKGNNPDRPRNLAKSVTVE